MDNGELPHAELLIRPNWAVFSPCGRYRYWLHRSWETGVGWTVYVMLNPSTADAETDDPTIRRCIDFGKSFGSKGIIVVNLYAWRATDPRSLGKRGLSDCIGPDNRTYIVAACEIAGRSEIDGLVDGEVVCAWGTHKIATMERVSETMKWIRAAYPDIPKCFGTTRSGAPKHPLYLPKHPDLQPYKGPWL